jgi:Fe-S-cluster containining protein
MLNYNPDIARSNPSRRILNGADVDNCKKCGRCCSNLRKGEDKSGLTLFIDEISLFPDDKIRPYIGKGVESVTEIFAYQHTDNVCVHLVNNQCVIYEHRPIMCRSFPVKVGKYGLKFISGCIGVREMLKKSVNLSHDMYEVKAAISMTERLHKFYKSFINGEKRWRYNLLTEVWDPY